MTTPRWDPKSRAGAVAIRAHRSFDLAAIKDVLDNVHRVATHQDAGGAWEPPEPSPVTGTYDWRAYLLEETHLAHRRVADRLREADRRLPPMKPRPAPHDLYA